MVELNMDELSLPRIFEQARKIHQAASDCSVDQVSVHWHALDLDLDEPIVLTFDHFYRKW